MIDVEALAGKTVQGWLLGDILGNGADGVVYVGSRDTQKIAVKIFYPEALEKNGADEQNERLELQLQLKGEKHHPNLVEIFDGGFDEELRTLYLVMEYVPGRPLNKVLQELPRESIPKLLNQLVGAVRYLESKDLYHRDIKPANIVVSDDFNNITLLDLGIVFRMPTDDEDQRLSGDEFVASVRYSPPEFVWRREDASNTDAWRAITFYQIGATLHDMLMKKPIFEGFDTPRADLYDSVKLRSPSLDAADCASWLTELAKACLIKDWRTRVEMVKWEMFQEPELVGMDITARSQAIRLRQIRLQEAKIMEKEQGQAVPKETRAQELWNLQGQVFMEIRDFIMNSQIFPKFTANHECVSNQLYRLVFKFEKDSAYSFDELVVFEVSLGICPTQSSKTDLLILGGPEGGDMVKAEWSEILSLGGIVDRCQDALIEVANKIVS